MGTQWICTCGHINNNKFCENCGNRKPETIEKATYNVEWQCICGYTNNNNFCVKCGRSKQQVIGIYSKDHIEAEAEAKRRAEAEAEVKRRAEAEAEVKRRAEAEAEAKRCAEAEAEAKRRAEAEAEAKRRAEAEAEAERRAEAEAEAKRRAEAEAEAKRRAEAEAEAKRRAEAEAEAKHRGRKGEITSKIDRPDLRWHSSRKKNILGLIVGALIVAVIAFCGIKSGVLPYSQSDRDEVVKSDIADHKVDNDIEVHLQEKYKQELIEQNAKLLQDADEIGKIVFIPESLEKIDDSTLKMTGYFYNGKGVVKKISKVKLDCSLMDGDNVTNTATGIICDINGFDNINLGPSERTGSISLELPITTVNINFDHFIVTNSKVAVAR